MKNRFKRTNILFLLLLLVGIGIGYALLSAELNIVGTTQIANSSWNIHFANLVEDENNVVLSQEDSAAEINSQDDTLVEYTVTLNKPGDYYEFLVDAVNEGTVDGMIGQIVTKLNDVDISNQNPLPSYLSYSFSYSDGTPLAVYQLLAAGDSETLKVRVEFLKDIEEADLNPDDESYDFTFGIKYVQVDENAVEIDHIGDQDGFKITFDSQGGSSVSPVYRDENQNAGVLPTPVQDGYVFDGWYTEMEGGTKILSTTPITADIKIFAHWTPLICRKVVSDSNLHREKCITGGGCTVNNKYSVGDDITYGSTVNGLVKVGDAFDCKLRTTGGYDTRFYYLGTTENDNVALIGYSIVVGGEFVTTNDATQLTFAQAHAALPSSSQWNNIPVTFTFDSSEKAARLAKPEEIRKACGFSTVATTSNGGLSECVFIYENTKYATGNGRSAYWIDMYNNKYYRVFTTNVSLQTPDTGAESKNSVKPVIEVPIRLVEDAELLTASYEVTFNANGGTVNNDSTYVTHMGYGEVLGTLPIPEKEHSIFEGWYTEENGGVQITAASTVTSDVEYFARWKKTVGLATISNSNISLIAGLTETINITNSEEIGENYTFSSGNDGVATVNSSGLVTAVGVGTTTITITGASSHETATVSVTVTANVGTYTVTFNSMGGTPAEVEYTRNANEMIASFPTVTKEHSILDGWYTEEDGGIKISESSTVVQDVEYFAHWKKAVSQAVVSNNPIVVAADTAENIVISNANEIGETYTFTSNNTSIATVDSNGQVTGVDVGSTTITITGDISNETATVNVTVTAGSITITFYPQGGSNVNPRDIPSGSTIGELPITTRAGYHFEGWYDDPSNGNLIHSTDAFSIDTPIYAHWVAYLCTAVRNETDLTSQLCSSSSGKGCLAEGYSSGAKITYGSIAEGSPVAGNAYDCIVYRDDYDYETERFYFLRQNGDNGVLISNTVASLANQGVVGSTSESLQYTEALNALPSTTQWNNLPVTFTLTDINNAVKPARLATLADISAACGINNIGTGSVIPIPACEYLLESSGYADNSGNNGRSGFWISKNGSTYYRVMGTDRKVVSPSDGTSANSSKPVIEVPMDLIETVVVVRHTVTFDSEGGSSIASKSVVDNTQIGRLETPTRANYTFEGWYTDTSYMTRVKPTTVITSGMTLHAAWEPASTSFPYVFRVLGECNFHGNSSTGDTQNTDAGMITSLECIGLDNTDYTNGKYIDTGVSLYSSTNINKDFEIGFTIESYSPNSYRETLANTKKEETPYPGLTFRRNNSSTTDFVFQSRKTSGANAEQTFSMSSVDKVTITRINGSISYSINDNEPIELHKLSDYGTYPTFDLTTWFGAAPSNAAATSAVRYLNGTLSNMYVKLGTYEDAATYKVTFNAMGGEVTPSYLKVPKNTALASLPTPTKTGFSFVGWYTEETGGVAVNPSATITQNVVYFARWVANVDGATLNTDNTYINMGGTKTITLSSLNSTVEPHSFASSDQSVATVSSDGVITPVSVGSTTITITGTNSHATQTVDVTVMNKTVSPVNFNIDNSAIATYMANKATWNANNDETTFMAGMDANYSSNNCICNDNQCQYRTNISTSQTTYCDKPLNYNTNTSTSLKVYTYDLVNNSTINEVLYTRSSTGYIYNMIPGYTYYWEEENDPTQYGFVTASGSRRIIDVDGVRNVRDLGGQQVDIDHNGTIDGTVKYEKLFRAERLWENQPAHVTAMVNLGVTEEVDLRASSEIPSGESKLTNYKHREIKHYQIDQTNYPSYYLMVRNLVTEVMRDVVNGENVYFHCRIGADRTGTLAYILEGLLGVVDEDRLVDYELSYYAGLVKRNRYYYVDPQSSVSKTEKFGYMYNIIPTSSAVYQWFMDGSDNQSEDAALITQFRNAMIDMNS